jgi:hypothetical protein
VATRAFQIVERKYRCTTSDAHTSGTGTRRSQGEDDGDEKFKTTGAKTTPAPTTSMLIVGPDGVETREVPMERNMLPGDDTRHIMHDVDDEAVASGKANSCAKHAEVPVDGQVELEPAPSCGPCESS